MQPVDAGEFATAMTGLGPFEPNPVLAIGVSGGRDSMALLHLADEWARGLGGRIIALTVDHNIRPESADEARQVGLWAAGLGIEPVVLTWAEPDVTAGGLQDRARQARHNLLEEAARQRGILHLLLAHHADDQAETVLLRLSKGSGPDGLAAMSALTHKPHVRVLRPLLGFPRDRLTATCQARNQAWIDDPSNMSDRFARPRLRAVVDALQGEGLTAHNLALTARALGRARAALERMTADVLARHASIFPQGYAEISLDGWEEVDGELKRRALSQLLQGIGGKDYQSKAEALDELIVRLPKGQVGLTASEGGRATLGNCLIEQTGNNIRIIREDRNIPPSQLLEPSQFMQWDRFSVWASSSFSVGALGEDRPEGAPDLPPLILATQPAFRHDGHVMAVPTIGYYADPALIDVCKARFSPVFAAGLSDFAIV